MSKIYVRTIYGKDGQPVAFPNGITIGSGAAGTTNNIGIAGQQGFGVGICPNTLPTGMVELFGTRDQSSDNYGNYQYSDGSIMVWIPAFFYKYGTGSNGLGTNAVSIKSFGDYADVATANAAGYALHRAFYNAGVIQPGVFVDKYLCSNNAGIASSLKNGLPLSASSAHNPFTGLTGISANANYGAIAGAKTRGSKFFCNSRFIFSALALLSMAHADAATGTAACAWYDSAGIKNYPKGCNNNALGDSGDTTLAYISDGYSNNSGKTGSANFFSRTTHNGQNCGISDLNGNLLEINLGMTSDGSNFYLLKTSVDVASVTGSNTLATDAWGATGIAAMYDNIGATYGALTATSSVKYFGSSSQVFSEAVSGTAWSVTGAGIPLLTGVGGTNKFGSDSLFDYRINELCPLSGGYWLDGTNAGIWALNLSYSRSNSVHAMGFRSAMYL